MFKITIFSLIVLLVGTCISNAETIDVHIKGVDDGVKTSVQQDYKEAVLFAKREAIQRAGVKIESKTTVKNYILDEDYIESQAEAVLLPGYQILDMGYSADGTYQIALVGKVLVKNAETQKPRDIKNPLEKFENQYVILKARHSGKCLDVYAHYKYNAGRLIQYGCHKEANQQFKMKPAGDGYFKIVNRNSGRCLDVMYGDKRNLISIIQHDCHEGANQQFKFKLIGDGYFNIVNRNSGKCMDVWGAIEDNFSPIQQYECHTGENQQWEIELVPH